ncbi:hypothetical protein TSOC_007387 [Tetrabaena socialis]|uniref:Uncharacterized protein n=1 Tax=Tetrabaena socialis TaxID=47790 RepID=A0A2J8A168_9CHLO|nr:hypothetical protein TSOC_007387 [Tetrabaena socialis]|eukprot:PNH06262.1 hypothetical protein TSOC_007387 [Tetrabaena socialis]
MAKSGRSNSKKKLRTQRRAQVVEKTVWLARADEKRAATLAACIAADVVHVEPTCEVPAASDVAPMETSAPRPVRTVRVKKVQLKKTGRKGKQVGVLSGFSMFHKKGKKGNR